MLWTGSYVNLFILATKTNKYIKKINILLFLIAHRIYLFICKNETNEKIGEQCRDTGKWEKYHDTKKI